MIKKNIISIICLLLFCLPSFGQAKLVITDYHRTFIPLNDENNKLQIAIRMYYIKSTPYFVLVNPYTLKTKIKVAKNLRARPNNRLFYFSMKSIQNTPYLKALNHYSLPPYKLANYGATKSDHPVNGVFLTVDLCPSIRPFEKKFFQTLANLSSKTHMPTPVAISISGLWLIAHAKEFNWLLDQQKNKKLAITWINHSFTHNYYYDLSFKHNFLLIPGTNIEKEILETEKLLIENHQVPSPFFRFPGLISNKKLINKLRLYGLIPIGSNAWLTKDQIPKLGSFILVHGNGNEPKGIKMIMPILHAQQFQLLPLKMAFT